MHKPFMKEYEAPVYSPFNRDDTWNAAAGHASTALYTGSDLERKVFELLPDELRSVDNFPDATVYHMTNEFIRIIAELQLGYMFYINQRVTLPLDEAQLRNLKNSASSMRIQHVVRQTQELFHPLTYDIIKPHIEDGDSQAIDSWVQDIKSRANTALRRIAQNFIYTIAGVPQPPEGYYTGENAQHYEEFSQDINDYNYKPISAVSLDAL